MRFQTIFNVVALTLALTTATGSQATPERLAAGGPPNDPDDITAEIQQLKVTAAQGSTGAQLQLGMMYETGQGAAQSDGEAVKWFSMAADRGDPRAKMLLIAACAHSIKGPAPEPCVPLAADLAAAAARGEVRAQTQLSAFYLTGASGFRKDPALAIDWLRKAADQGDIAAEVQLGLIYGTGQMGVAADPAQAINWYRKAAGQGDVGAMQILADTYQKGLDGVSKDWAEAAVWWRKAADLGNPVAQVALASMYAAGDGVPEDPAQAALWYRKAAEQGDANAAAGLATAYAGGKGVPQDDVQAYIWMHAAITRSQDLPGGPPDYWIYFLEIVDKRLSGSQLSAAETQAAALEARLSGRDPVQDAKLKAAFGF